MLADTITSALHRFIDSRLRWMYVSVDINVQLRAILRLCSSVRWVRLALAKHTATQVGGSTFLSSLLPTQIYSVWLEFCLKFFTNVNTFPTYIGVFKSQVLVLFYISAPSKS